MLGYIQHFICFEDHRVDFQNSFLFQSIITIFFSLISVDTDETLHNMVILIYAVYQYTYLRVEHLQESKECSHPCFENCVKL